MFKKTLFLFLLFAIALGSVAVGQSRRSIKYEQYKGMKWGAGFRLGEPSGLTLRYYYHHDLTFDFTVGMPALFWLSEEEGGKILFKGPPNGSYVGLNAAKYGDLGDIIGLEYYIGGGPFYMNRKWYSPAQGDMGTQTRPLKEDGFGISTVAGIEYHVPSSEAEVFYEVSPSVQFADNERTGSESKFIFFSSAGVRFLF